LDGCWLPRARRPAGTTRVPYTTLFRSLSEIGEEVAGDEKKKNITVIKNQTNFFYSPKEDSSSIVLTDGTLGSCMNSGVPNTRVPLDFSMILVWPYWRGTFPALSWVASAKEK